MAKKTKKGRKADELICKKSKNTLKVDKVNPFEIHSNKQKFDILGRPRKHDHGRPGVSRQKAVKRRMQTLGNEFQNLRKSNKIKDNRIKQNGTDVEARFISEQMAEFRSRTRKNIFDLNDDEILTHKGQTIEEIENFDDVESDDEEEILDAEFTEAAHFGNNSNDRKTAIEDLIIDMKRKRLEMAKEKEEIQEMTINLDENYKKLIPLMGKLNRNSNGIEKTVPDEYDRIMREMIFEPRGEVSDKLQSKEDIAKKEKEKLEKLEQERLLRMRGEEVDSIKQPTHKSADDLDDGYFVDGSEEEGVETLTYDLNENPIINKAHQNVKAGEDKEKANDNEEHSDGHEEDAVENEDEDESDDDFSDLKVTDSESEAENFEDSKRKNELQKSRNEIKKPDDKTFNELPFVIDMPTNYEELKQLLDKKSPDIQKTIIDRIIKCNHPKLDGANRQKCVQLFSYLLKFIEELFASTNEDVNLQESFKLLNYIMPQLYDLISIDSEKCSKLFVSIMKEKYDNFIKKPKNYPSIDVLVLFKIISNLFSTSDFRHPVVTLAFIFISHILTRCKIRTRKDCAKGLFICTVVLEYIELSKRILPMCFSYLLGIIYLAIPKKSIEILKICPPFESVGTLSNILCLEENLDCEEEFLLSSDLVAVNMNESFKIRALNTALKLTKDFITAVEENFCCNYFSKSFLQLFDRLNIEYYPKYVNDNFSILIEILTSQSNKPLNRLVAAARKPKALRLIEPRIEKIYDEKRRPKMSKEKEMRKIMEHKIKRETKGALREIRRDTEFLQSLKIKQQATSDIERKEKVKRIYAEASMQQGELNELSRQKKKKGKF